MGFFPAYDRWLYYSFVFLVLMFNGEVITVLILGKKYDVTGNRYKLWRHYKPQTETPNYKFGSVQNGSGRKLVVYNTDHIDGDNLSIAKYNQ